MAKATSKKQLLLCLVLSIAVIIAGAFVFGFLGFNEDSSVSDKTAVEVQTPISFFASDDDQESFVSVCEETIENAGYTVAETNYYEESSGIYDYYEFVITRSTGTFTQDEKDALCEALETAIYALSDSDVGNVEITRDILLSVVTVESENQYYWEYVWRTAIAVGCVWVIAAAYVAIRFKLGMGVTLLVANAHDVLLTLAVIAILRIPVNTTVIGVAALSVMVSLFMNLCVLGRMRLNFRSEDWKGIPSREAVAKSASESRKTVLLTAAAMAVILVLIGIGGIFFSLDLTFIMIGGLIATAVSVYSSLFLTPAVYAGMKERSDKIAEERMKYDYISDKERKRREKEERRRQEEEEVPAEGE